MSITDELRKYARGYKPLVDHTLLEIADSIDAEYQKAEDEWRAEHGQMWLKGYSECHAELMEGNEVIAADLEKVGWVRGPLDADGEIWHSGDMSDSNWGVIEGIAYEDGRWLVSGHDTSAPWIPADSIRHYHPPTVEDVLREFANECLTYATCVDDHEVADAIELYAAKLRLAGEDE